MGTEMKLLPLFVGFIGVNGYLRQSKEAREILKGRGKQRWKKCNGPIPYGMVQGQGQLEIRCDDGYELKNPDEKYKCNKKKIRGKKARVVEPEPKCVPATTTIAYTTTPTPYTTTKAQKDTKKTTKAPYTTKGSKTPKPTNKPTPTQDPYNGGDNSHWWPKADCKQPVNNGVNYSIIDDTYSVNRGYSYVVNVQTVASKVQHPFTVVMEMDPDEEGGNIQMFNFEYFGFYPGYVTLHSKEGHDGAVIIGTNFSKHTLPKIYVLRGHDKEHACYRFNERSLGLGGYETGTYEWFQRIGEIEAISDVTHVVYRAFDGRVGILN